MSVDSLFFWNKGYPNVFGLVSKPKASILVLFTRLILTPKKPNRCSSKLEKKEKEKKEMERITLSELKVNE